MLVQPQIRIRSMVRHLWPITLTITVYASAVSWVDAQYHLERYQLPVTFATLPGAFVGVLLAFRTNSSYGRWWEARILWGQIVNESRTWARQLIAFGGSVAGGDAVGHQTRRMALRQIAWCSALTRTLRQEPPLQDAAERLDSPERVSLQGHRNVPNAILLRQAEDLRSLADRGAIDAYQWVALEATLTRLTDAMGGCERIRNTPFPPHYRVWIHYLIYLFTLMLPFTFVNAPAWVITVVTVTVAVGYLIVERVAMFLETPFAEAATGIPMTTLSRAIEIDILQMLGERETPPPLEPQDGVLY